MDLPKIPKFELEFESPSNHCIRLVKEADHMLKDLAIMSTCNKSAKHIARLMPNNFINAIEALSTRFKSAKISSKCNFSRPVLTPTDNLGPGSYTPSRPLTPAIQNVRTSTFLLSQSKSN